MLSFILIFFMNGVLLLIWNFYANEKEKVKEYYLEILAAQKMLNANVINANNFLIVDIKDTALYKNKTSANVDQFVQGNIDLKNSIFFFNRIITNLYKYTHQATKIAIQQAVNQAVAIAVSNAIASRQQNNPSAGAMSNSGNLLFKSKAFLYLG